ncbi:aminopeptidase N [Rothia nasisuis]|uniref:aminopeptidase N n=1 Tax=Rothia nasisuis TaxID=2109647 RepID=UPI001EFF8112|nr:aminopeptidase N [Rothia nasisuis]
MNNENLTQQEAALRARTISVDTYDVHVNLAHATADFETYPVATTVRFTATEGASTFIDYIHQSVESVNLNGVSLPVDEVVEGSRIALPHLQERNTLTIRGRSYFSRSGEGLHRYIDPADGKIYLYTQYEPADCRRVFPNFEQPDLKAVFNFRITAPKNWVVSSNGELERHIDDPSDSSISQRVFKPTARISTYITAIVAGEYFTAFDTYTPASTVNSGPIPLVAYCRQSLKEHFDYQNIFTVTKQGLDYFQNLFDYAYPYPKYEQAFVPEYNLGAMENPGLVTFTENYIFVSGADQSQFEGRANVICHEMSHMWFGNLVTMKWWNDLWLKESFADFMGHLGASEVGGYKDAWVTFANSRKAWAYRQDQLPTTHPIMADIPHLEAARQNFDGITYAKGASALKQLVAYVGFERFVEATRLYFRRFAWGNTVLDDFLGVLGEVSDRDMRLWADAWLLTPGLSELSCERLRGGDGEVSGLVLRQVLPPQVSVGVGRPHRLKVGTFVLVGGRLQATGLIPVDFPAGVSEVSVGLAGEQVQLVGEADLLLLNAEDLTYAKVALSEADGLDVALAHVSSLEDALSRGLVWGSLWGMVRDGRLASHRFVQAVCQAVALERSATLLANIVNQAQAAISLYTAEPLRAELWDAFSSALGQALELVGAGSDEQLIVVRAALAASAHSDVGADLVKDVARGALGPVEGELVEAPGRTYDQGLGWKALGALAVRGQVSVQELECARAYRPSAVSERGFAFACAALPTELAKHQAWVSVTGDVSLSNDLLSATAAGFQQGSEALRAGYRERFFDMLLSTWAERSGGMATRVIRGLYPQVELAGGDASAHPVVLATRCWLAESQGAPTALVRLMRELLDDAQRILRAQKFNS